MDEGSNPQDPVLEVGDAGCLDGPDLLESHISVSEVVEGARTRARRRRSAPSLDSRSGLCVLDIRLVSAPSGHSTCWPALFGLDPAEQVLLADRLEQRGVVAGHVPPNEPDDPVVVVAPCHVPALA